jgi:transcription factor IIIB 90 kDa subunit
MSTVSVTSPQASRFKGPRKHVPRLATTKRIPGQPPFIRPPSLNAPTPSRSRVTMTCPNDACPNPNIIEDDGRSVCATCGVVARESNIVSELQFGETSSGAAAVQGSYVGEGRTHGQSSGGPHPGLTHDGLSSREMTILNARREIDSLINNLRIPANLADPAVNIFKLSLAHAIYDSDGNREKDRKNFVQGRSIRTVSAVALYVACRRQKNTNTIMLIDLAETMTPQVSVFKMGNIYNRLVRAIWGTADGSISSQGYVDPINPENLIRRFARELEFGVVVGKVTEDAIRLVQRMDRDWMTTGRRPAGICGAALILAARMNNFRRTVREVVLVVKVSEITVHNRLVEFQHTESSNLTVQQMRQGDHTAPSDPPAFYRANGEGQQPKKRGRKRKNQGPETAAEIENSDEQSGERPLKKGRVDKDGFAIPDIPIDPTLQTTSTISSSNEVRSAAPASAVSSALFEMEQEGESSERPRRVGRPKGSKNKHAPEATDAEVALEAEIQHDILNTISSEAMQRVAPSVTPTSSARSNPGAESSQASAQNSQLTAHIDISNQPPGANSAAKTITRKGSAKQTQAIPPRPREIRMDPEILETEFEDDPEVANVILSEEEVLIKEHIWVQENKQWLRDEHVKRIKKQLQDAADIAAGIVPGSSNKKKRRRGRRLGDVSYLKDNEKASENGEGEGEQDEATRSRRAASIAMKGMLEQRGYSRRLNYDALSKIFPDDMANVRESSIESRRTVRKSLDATPPRGSSVAESNGTEASQTSRPAASKVSSPPSPSPPRPVVPAPSTSRPAEPLPTPPATQQEQQPTQAPIPPPPPRAPSPTHPNAILEGEEELIGELSASDSPLSSLQPTLSYHSPMIGAAQSGGFGDGGEDDEEDDEDDDEEEYVADEIDDVDEALQGRFRRRFDDEEEDEDEDDED